MLVYSSEKWRFTLYADRHTLFPSKLERREIVSWFPLFVRMWITRWRLLIFTHTREGILSVSCCLSRTQEPCPFRHFSSHLRGKCSLSDSDFVGTTRRQTCSLFRRAKKKIFPACLVASNSEKFHTEGERYKYREREIWWNYYSGYLLEEQLEMLDNDGNLTRLVNVEGWRYVARRSDSPRELVSPLYLRTRRRSCFQPVLHRTWDTFSPKKSLLSPVAARKTHTSMQDPFPRLFFPHLFFCTRSFLFFSRHEYYSTRNSVVVVVGIGQSSSRSLDSISETNLSIFLLFRIFSHFHAGERSTEGGIVR